MQGISDHKTLEVAVNRAIAEGGIVREDASEDVSRTRARVRSVESKLRNALKGMPGEMSEQVCLCLIRFCYDKSDDRAHT